MEEGIKGDDESAAPPALSKSAQKKLLKQQRQAERKAKRKAAEKERRRADLHRRRAEWEEQLAAATEEERHRLVESRRTARRERVEQRAEERDARAARLGRAAESGQKLVLDLEFAHLMTAAEINSLVHQVMYCYAVNGRSPSPAHLWLTGCTGEIATQLQRISGYDKWIIEKEDRSYIEALQDHKENLVYLTADAETVLDELDPKKVYIVGGLVDRNRWKGITMKKANDQGIKSAKLPISNYLKMSSSKVLTVNQVVEILIRYLETKDWRSAFFQVIPQRKICEADGEVEEAEDATDNPMEEALVGVEGSLRKKQRMDDLESDEAKDTAGMPTDGIEDVEEDSNVGEGQHIKEVRNDEKEDL